MIRNNYDFCIASHLFDDAYRSARFLSQVSVSPSYWRKMKTLINNITKAQYKVDYAYLRYCKYPDKQNKQKLLKLINKHPYVIYKWKSYIAFAENASNERIKMHYQDLWR